MTAVLKEIFPVCLEHIPLDFWSAEGCSPADSTAADRFIAHLTAYVATGNAAGYLPDLARVEWAGYQQREQIAVVAHPEERYQVNPTLQLVPVSWHPLLPLMDGETLAPQPCNQQYLAFWKHPITQTLHRCIAGPSELLALKAVAEQLDPRVIATESGCSVGVVDLALERGVNLGLVLAPASKLKRVGSPFAQDSALGGTYSSAEVFTLQWHITHRCDLHCRHCYDRSVLADVDLAEGIRILDQMRDFCFANHVGGQVSFSGGNPFMHPNFFELYQEARDRNLNLAILGNPVQEAQLDALLDIARPSFYQVSLEGLEVHNDLIRGPGNFQSVMAFLDLLKRKKVYSMVMLTLTRANMDQVLPLAEILRGRVDLFTYNRLSMVGEGANLVSPAAEEYRIFVRQYLEARKQNSVMAVKDSLINIERVQTLQGVFGGCTGFGCGAAFNFVSLLPDGQVHACRKFPSPIGHIGEASLSAIYASEGAKAYRLGCLECASCRIRPVCGGCLAVAYGWGLDPLLKKDPGCFMPEGV